MSTPRKRLDRPQGWHYSFHVDDVRRAEPGARLAERETSAEGRQRAAGYGGGSGRQVGGSGSSGNGKQRQRGALSATARGGAEERRIRRPPP